jgi:protein ImuB
MFACIFIPDFMVEAVLRAEPMLRGRAVALLEGKPPLCYVVAANEAARRLGIEIGMTKLLAEALKATEEPKIGRTEDQPKNRRSGEPKSKQNKDEQQNFTPNCFPHDNEREERSRRPHAQGAYEATYGCMNPRFGLYRTRLDADELNENRRGEVATASSNHEGGPRSARNDKKSRNDKKVYEERRTRNEEPVRDWHLETDNSPLILRNRYVAAEFSAHAALLDAAHAVSPRVEDSAQDAVALDISGLDRLFGTSQQVAQELVRRVSEVGLVANVAIAANPNAAEHAARGYPGMTIITAGQEAARLGTLPLDVLFASERSALARLTRRREEQRKSSERFTAMQETLDRWGIRNFRALAALPPVSLSERLGTDGVRLQILASGVATRELVLSEPAQRFEETIELDYPVDVLEPLAFLLARMLDGLCGRLAARALATNELRLRMKLEYRTGDDTAISEAELEGEPIVERKLVLPVPMNDARLFLKLLQLELSASPPGAPVTQLWLVAEPARSRAGQGGLFQPLAPEAEKLELTLARLHKLLGVRERIGAGFAEIVDTHQPDQFVVKRFQPGKESSAFNVPRSSLNGSQLSIPRSQLEKDPHPSVQLCETDASFSLRRFRPPFPAEVELRGGEPVRVRCVELGARDPLHDNIIWVAGPWRTSGNWWEGNGKTVNRQNSKKTKSENEEVKDELAKGIPRSARNDKKPYEYEERGTRNEEPTGSRELGTGNSPAESWNSEEWDVALAVTRRGVSRRERTTEIGLYRLVRDCIVGQWSVDGAYD